MVLVCDLVVCCRRRCHFSASVSVCLPLDLLALFLFSPFLSVLSSLAPSQTKPNQSSLFDMTPKKVIYLFLCLSVCPLLSGGFLCPRPVQFSSVFGVSVCVPLLLSSAILYPPAANILSLFSFLSSNVRLQSQSQPLFASVIDMYFYTFDCENGFAAAAADSSVFCFFFFFFRMLIYLVQSMTTMMMLMRMKRKVPLFILLALAIILLQSYFL